MQPVAIIGSLLSHGGAVTGGSTKTTAGGIPIARFGDTATCSSHGPTTINMASTTRFDLDGKAIARIGDTTACGATITTGDLTVLVS